MQTPSTLQTPTTAGNRCGAADTSTHVFVVLSNRCCVVVQREGSCVSFCSAGRNGGNAPPVPATSHALCRTPVRIQLGARA